MEGTWHTDVVVTTSGMTLERVRQSASGPFRRTHQIEHLALIYLPAPFREAARGCFGTPTSHRSLQSFGSAILVPPHVPVHIHSPGFESRTMLVLRFADGALPLPAAIDGGDANVLLRCLDVRGRGVMETMDRIFREVEGCAVGRDTILAGLALMLSGELVRHIDGLQSRPNDSSVLTDWQMRQIGVRIAATDLPPPCVDELAALCGLGRRHLMRSFKARTGLTVMEWVEQATFERATRMLEQESTAIKAIAATLGYRHPGSFATAFNRRFGMSPRSWRMRSLVQH